MECRLRQKCESDFANAICDATNTICYNRFSMIDVAVSINENQFCMSAAAIIDEYNMPSRFSLYILQFQMRN